MAQTAITDYEILEAALMGLEHQRSQFDDKIAELRRRLGVRGMRVSSVMSAAVSDGAAAPGGNRPRFSAAARRRMAAAQRKRWAALKKGTAAKVAAPAKKKRKISVAARARMSAATKKRWAEYRKKKAAA